MVNAESSHKWRKTSPVELTHRFGDGRIKAWIAAGAPGPVPTAANRWSRTRIAVLVLPVTGSPAGTPVGTRPVRNPIGDAFPPKARIQGSSAIRARPGKTPLNAARLLEPHRHATNPLRDADIRRSRLHRLTRSSYTVFSPRRHYGKRMGPGTGWISPATPISKASSDDGVVHFAWRYRDYADPSLMPISRNDRLHHRANLPARKMSDDWKKKDNKLTSQRNHRSPCR